MTTRRRVATMLLGAFAFGVVAGVIAGGGGTGTGAEVRNAIANLSTPWLLVGFVAGTGFSRLRTGALAGLVATMVALTGFYLVKALVHGNDLGFVGDLRFELSANRGYLQGGIVTGLAFGVLGAWWQKRRTWRASVLAGALLMAEPLVLVLIGLVGPGGVLDADGATPTVFRIIPGWELTADTPTVSIAVYVAEFVLGLAIVLWAVLRPRRSLATSA